MEDGLRSMQVLFSRISAFFDIFDLSFLVSGAVSVGALALIGHTAGVTEAPLSNGWLVAAVLIASYVLGLLCFSLGRLLRRVVINRRTKSAFSQRFKKLLDDALKAHGLSDIALAAPPSGPATESAPLWQRSLSHYDASTENPNHNGASFKYTLLWTKLRQSPHLAPSLNLLNRYWVMTATFDGMTVALFFWCGAIVGWSVVLASSAALAVLGFVAAAGALVASALCIREAERYMYTQIDELCATVAWDQIERPTAPLQSVNIQVKSPSGD